MPTETLNALNTNIYGVRLLSYSEWKEAYSRLQEKQICHLLNPEGMFWCYDTVQGKDSERIVTGYKKDPLEHGSADCTYQYSKLGFRPCLDCSTKGVEDIIENLADGDVWIGGYLYMGMEAEQPLPFPTKDEEIQSSRKFKLRKADNIIIRFDDGINFDSPYEDNGFYIHWIKVGKLLIAERTVINGVNWNKLDRSGFAIEPKIIISSKDSIEMRNSTLPPKNQKNTSEKRSAATKRLLAADEIWSEGEQTEKQDSKPKRENNSQTLKIPTTPSYPSETSNFSSRQMPSAVDLAKANRDRIRMFNTPDSDYLPPVKKMNTATQFNSIMSSELSLFEVSSEAVEAAISNDAMGKGASNKISHFSENSTIAEFIAYISEHDADSKIIIEVSPVFENGKAFIRIGKSKI